MPHYKRSHLESQGVLCVICFSKAGKDLRNISPDTALLIQGFLFPDYTQQDENFPTAICSQCRKGLSKIRDGKGTPEDLKMYDRKSLVLKSVETRNPNIVCHCSICSIAQSNLNQNQSFQNPPGPRSQSPAENLKSTSVKICSSCYNVLSKGKSHICLQSKKMGNINSLLSTNNLILLITYLGVVLTIKNFKISFI